MFHPHLAHSNTLAGNDHNKMYGLIFFRDSPFHPEEAELSLISFSTEPPRPGTPPTFPSLPPAVLPLLPVNQPCLPAGRLISANTNTAFRRTHCPSLWLLRSASNLPHFTRPDQEPPVTSAFPFSFPFLTRVKNVFLRPSRPRIHGLFDLWTRRTPLYICRRNRIREFNAT